tara:strand:- start:304 stop:1419 length:1116 start_codon:yes stop_codon:yes gene_type:complete
MGVIIKGTDDSIKAADGSLSIEGFSIKTTGIGTFEGGIQVGSAATIHSNGNLGLTGIITAANFKTGDSNVHNTGYNVGSGVTIDGNTGNIAVSGIITAASFSGVTATTINNNADNRIITGSGTADTLNGEANVTYDGANWIQTSSSDVHFKLTSATTGYSRICLGDTDDDDIGEMLYNSAGNKLSFKTNATTHLEIQSDGDVEVNEGNLIIGTAGKGIDFSANTSTTTTGAAMTSELLDWYEEGTFTPKITFGNTSDFSGGSYGTCEGTYTRVGRMVTISFTTSISAKGSSSGLVHINGLPFTSGGSTFRGGGRTSYSTLFSSESDNVDCQLYLGDTRTYLQCIHDSLDNLNASDCNASGAINTTMQYQVP